MKSKIGYIFLQDIDYMEINIIADARQILNPAVKPKTQWSFSWCILDFILSLQQNECRGLHKGQYMTHVRLNLSSCWIVLSGNTLRITLMASLCIYTFEHAVSVIFFELSSSQTMLDATMTENDSFLAIFFGWKVGQSCNNMFLDIKQLKS